MRLGPIACLVALIAMPGPGCRTATQITLTVRTDIPCARVQETQLAVGTLAELERQVASSAALGCVDGYVGTVVVVPAGSRDDEVALRLVMGLGKSAETCAATGYGPGCIVARRALRFIPHTSLEVVVPLRSTCEGRPCKADETCRDGVCVPARIADSSSCTPCDERVLGDAGPAGTPPPDCGVGTFYTLRAGDGASAPSVARVPSSGETIVAWSTSDNMGYWVGDDAGKKIDSGFVTGPVATKIVGGPVRVAALDGAMAVAATGNDGTALPVVWTRASPAGSFTVTTGVGRGVVSIDAIAATKTSFAIAARGVADETLEVFTAKPSATGRTDLSGALAAGLTWSEPASRFGALNVAAGDLVFRSFDASLGTTSTPQVVGKAGASTSAAIAAVGDGFGMAWIDSSGDLVLAARDGTGRLVGPVAVAKPASKNVHLVAHDGWLVLAWLDSGSVVRIVRAAPSTLALSKPTCGTCSADAGATLDEDFGLAPGPSGTVLLAARTNLGGSVMQTLFRVGCPAS